MERIFSDEEKIRRAIEISQRRNNNYQYNNINTVARGNVREKKDYKLFKKMILQIIICLLIYIIFYLISSTDYVFSADVIKNTNEILSYDINFKEIYNNFMLFIKPDPNTNRQLVENNFVNNTIQTEEQEIQNNFVENTLIIEDNNSVERENIAKDSAETKEETNIANNVVEENENKDEKIENLEKTQMELDAEDASKVCQFKKPLSGTITSEFGEREATIKGMTTDHKGIDIAANSGTSIKSAITGTVTVAEENSEYGKFIKIVNENVMTVYAHCKSLKVKVGDKIKIGQIIATVGSTGNSTGPHLHFEIRFKNRYINPRYLIEF